MLENLKLGADVQQEVEKDTLGGGGPLESGVYDFVIKAAYLDAAKSKAISVNLVMETPQGRRLNVTEYITSGEAKGCLPYYVDKEGNKKPLPGYSKMNTLCQLVTGKEISEQDTEQKFFKLYDFDLRKETNQQKNAITGLINQSVKVGVFKVIEDKKAKVGNDYVPTGETREVNTAEKFFNADGKTIEEITGGKEASFINDWETAHAGKTKDKSTAKTTGAQSGAPSIGGVAPLQLT